MKPLILALVVTALLVGCAPTAPVAEPTPTASASAEASVPPISGLAEVGDTRWLIDDSQGDRTTVTFAADGTVAYTSEGQKFAYPEDTWSADGETLTWQITFGARYGVWTCSATFDPNSQTLSGTWTSTVGESGTLEGKRPVR